MQIETIIGIKSLAGIYNYLKNHSVHNINILKWRSLYHVTIGSHDDNLYLSIDLSLKSFSVIERQFNGKNYDLGKSGYLYPTNAGREKLIDFLNNEVTQSHH